MEGAVDEWEIREWEELYNVSLRRRNQPAKLWHSFRRWGWALRIERSAKVMWITLVHW